MGSIFGYTLIQQLQVKLNLLLHGSVQSYWHVIPLR